MKVFLVWFDPALYDLVAIEKSFVTEAILDALKFERVQVKELVSESLKGAYEAYRVSKVAHSLH